MKMSKMLQHVEDKKERLFEELSAIMNAPIDLPFEQESKIKPNPLQRSKLGAQELSSVQGRQKSTSTHPACNIFQNEDEAMSQLFSDLNDKLFDEGNGEDEEN